MKKVSIIVPVYNAEQYLEKCLDSLVNQTLGKEIEIIIVNDGSTDKSKQIVESYQKNYPDIIKAFTVENGGPAKARIFALKHATGEYIGFVDSDDYVVTDMFEKLYEMAKQEDADISTCGFYRFDNEKFVERETAIRECYGHDVYEYPSIFFNSLPYIWNKIFKRELIEKNNLTFHAELTIFEDLIFTYSSFIHANKITRIPQPLYYYRVDRDDSLSNTFRKERFDFFPAMDILIKYFKDNGVFEYFDDYLLFIILKHVFVILEKDNKLSEIGLKNKFLNKSFKYLTKNFPFWKEYRYYYKRFKKHRSLYKSKTYWRIRMFLKKNTLKKILKFKNNLFDALKMTKRKELGHYFLKYCKLPLEEDKIFINSQQGNNLSGNMFYIIKELVNNPNYKKFKIHVLCNKEKMEDFTQKLKYYNLYNRCTLIENDTKEYPKALATAKYLFTDTSFATYYMKRKGQVYLNTWHGTPLKTLGRATVEDFYDIANLQKNFAIADYVLFPSEYMKKYMLRDFMLSNIAKGKILLSGYPRNEVFLDENRRKELKKKLKLEDKELIAYMPTWRGNVRKVQLKKHIKEIENYLYSIDLHLKENQILYVNLHHYVGNNINFDLFKKVKPFPEELETYDFLNICDTLITDYSSVFFDYALTNKKIILFAYDKEEYFKNRGVYLQLEDLPFPIVENVEELIKEINKKIEYNQKEFLTTYCNYDRIDMSKKICELVLLNNDKELKIEEFPKNEKPNCLICAGNFQDTKITRKILDIINNTEPLKYNYFISYLTSEMKKNKKRLRMLKDNIFYWGQLRDLNLTSNSELTTIELSLRFKFLYKMKSKKIDNIYKNELKRIYVNDEFKKVLACGEIDNKMIYELSNYKAKKILYLSRFDLKHKKIPVSIYNRYDNIIADKQEIYDSIVQYLGTDKKIKLIKNITSLNDII